MNTKESILQEIDYLLFKIEDYISCDEGLNILEKLRDCFEHISLESKKENDFGDFDQINYDGERTWLV